MTLDPSDFGTALANAEAKSGQSPLSPGVGRYYRPRCAVRIDVPIEGTAGASTSGLGGLYVPSGQTTASHQDAEEASDGPDFGTATTTSNIVSVYCPARRVEHLRNSWFEADTLSAIVDWKLLGVDPRVLTSAVVTLYLGQADAQGNWSPTDDQIRFVGIMKRSKRIGGEDQALAVEILAHDYTTLFLEAKKFPTEGMPLFSDTVSQAWARICDHVGFPDQANPGKTISRVKVLKNGIQFIGAARDVLIGSAVTGRMASIGGRVSVDPKSDAWGVWVKTIGMLGLISYFDRDVLYVTTATDYYSGQNPPVFVWGDNIAEIAEERDTTLCGKGLHLQSFDPMTGTQIESFYPPLTDRSTRRSFVRAKRRNSQAKADPGIDYESQAYPGVSDQTKLDAICRENYVIMAHQEFAGRLVTHEMAVPADHGDLCFDLLNLAAGDAIEVLIDQQDQEALGDYPTDQAKTNYLIGLGYDQGLAQIVVANLNGILSLAPVYIVSRVVTTLETTEDGGNFSIEVQYCNKIDANGSSGGAA